jgi:hypothetical protein
MPAAVLDEDAWFSPDPVTRQLERRSYVDVVLLQGHRVAVSPAGVWVIASAEDRGRVDVTRGLLGRRRLLIHGEDRTELVTDLERQVDRVATVAGDTYVTGVLCLPNADLPLLRRLWLRDVVLCWPRALRKMVNARGELGEAEIAAIADDLAFAF